MFLNLKPGFWLKMDSLTHIALGACIGEAVLSRKVGKKALLLGAVAQSLPDIDVVASLWLQPAANLLVHRGITHSLLFGFIAAVLLSLLARKMLRVQHIPIADLFFFFCIQVWLHDLLDTCNAYGTGLFEPFSHQRFSINLLYVIDPFFSVSLVIAFIVLIILRSKNPVRNKWMLAGLIPCCMYFLFAVFNKISVSEQVKKWLLSERIPHRSFITTPTPFNTLLWYNIAAADSGYFVGYRSVFDKKSSPVHFVYYKKNEQLLQQINKNRSVKELLRFADNYFTVSGKEDSLVLNVLRFGQVFGWSNSKAHFAFQYFLNPSYDNSLVVQRERFKGWNRKTLTGIYNRIKGK